MKTLSVIISILFIGSNLYSQSISFDPTFGFSGIVIHNYSSGDENAHVIVEDSEGNFLVGGSAFNGTDEDVMISKYSPAGQLVSDFGELGTLIIPVGIGNDFIFDLKIQDDGKLVATGQTMLVEDNWDVLVIRVNADGSMDESFGDAGIQIIDAGPDDDYVLGLEILEDGSILVAGELDLEDSADGVLLIKFTPNGALDNTFGTDGIVTTTFNLFDDQGRNLCLQEDEKILVTGYTNNGVSGDLLVIRYNSDGSLDNTFGLNGIVLTEIGSLRDRSFSIKVQPDGKIVQTGTTEINEEDWDFVIVRYNTDGTLDTSFSDDGILVLAPGPEEDVLRDFHIFDNGRILAVGYIENEDKDAGIIVLEPNGDLVEEIGIYSTSIGFNSEWTYDCVISEEGDLLITGRLNNSSDFDYFVAKFNIDIDVSVEEISSHKNGAQVYPTQIEEINFIELDLFHPASVSFMVMDLLGRRVSVPLKSKLLSQGNHVIPINIIENLPRGNYLGILEINGNKQSFLLQK